MIANFILCLMLAVVLTMAAAPVLGINPYYSMLGAAGLGTLGGIPAVIYWGQKDTTASPRQQTLRIFLSTYFGVPLGMAVAVWIGGHVWPYETRSYPGPWFAYHAGIVLMVGLGSLTAPRLMEHVSKPGFITQLWRFISGFIPRQKP